MNITTLHLEPGFWRSSVNSEEVLPCLSEDHCIGGPELSQLCAPGYTGPLCAVCETSYAAVGSGADLKCEECTGSATATIAAGSSVFAIVVGIFVFRLFRSKGSVVDAIEKGADDFERASELRGRISEKLSLVSDMVEKYQPPAKIFLSYYQIVCGLSFAYDLRFPALFTKFKNAVSTVVNLDFISFMPIGCMTETNFHHSLVGYTLGPLLVFALMLAVYGSNKNKNPALANRVFSYFLALTFLVLPSVSIKIFSTFACRIFDGDYGRFLKVDYNIDCDGDEHAFYEAYAMIMALVFPIGVPLMYFVLLYRRRDMLDPGQKKFTHELGSEELGMQRAILEREKLMVGDPSLAALSFLFHAYEPQCWWFEVVETLRRLLLTGGLLFLNPGTAGQIIASMIMCLGAMRVYAGYKPFVEDNNDVLAETAQWQLFFTMFAALAIRVDADDESLQDKQAFDVMLCVIQVAAVGVGLAKYAFCKGDVESVKQAVSESFSGGGDEEEVEDNGNFEGALVSVKQAAAKTKEFAL